MSNDKTRAATEIRDNRELMRNREREVCRVCGSQDVHSPTYGKPTMKCVASLKQFVAHLEGERDELKAKVEAYEAMLAATDIIHFANHLIEHGMDGNGDWWIVRDNSGKALADKYTALEAFNALRGEE